MAGLPLTPASEITFGTVDDGMYQATFSGYSQPQKSQFNAAQKYTNLSFTIVGDEDYDGESVDGSVTIDSKKWVDWIGAIEGGEYTGQGELDDLVGNQVVVTVENKDKGENTYSNVVKVAPSRRKKKSRPAPKPQADDFDVEEEWEDD